MSEIINVNKIPVSLGEQEVVKLHVGRLPSGNRIQIQAHVYRAEKPGPTMLVLAGVHGDEINGVEIVRRTIEYRMFEKLEMGTVIAIPLLNIYGFINFSREVPDGKDVNRSFPGSRAGSLASRVASTLTKKVLPHIDFGVDFHTGGRSHYNYPQVRFSKGDARSEELARAFSAPYLISNKPIAKSLRKTALDHGKPILVFEGGENLRFDGFSIEKGLAGLRRLMYHQGMIKQSEKEEKSILFARTSWIRAPRSGIFRWSKCSGHKIYKSEPIGVINDPYGQEEIVIYAPRDAYIIGHNNSSVVSQGDALYHLGFETY